MKKLVTIFNSITSGAVFFFSLFLAQALAQVTVAPTPLPDLEVTSLTFAKQDDDDFTFKYKVSNMGKGGPVFLESYYYIAYISKNATLDPNDIQVGRANFGNNAPELGYRESYAATFKTSLEVSIEAYHYLIFEAKLRPGYSQSEATQTNNRLIVDMAPGFPDLAVKSVTIANLIGQNGVKVNYEVINNGSSDLHLEKYAFDTYVSNNTTWEVANDIFSSGGKFSTTANILSPGEIFKGSFTANPGSSVDLNKYSNLIFTTRLLDGRIEPQKSRSNDIVVKSLIPYFADLEIDYVRVDDITEEEITFTYSITNKGASDLILDKLYLQTYVSKNNIHEVTDIKTGGILLSVPAGKLRLAPNGKFVGTFVSSINVNLSYFPYLICDVTRTAGNIQPQKLFTNDRKATHLGKIAPKIFIVNQRASYSGMNVDVYFDINNGGNQNLDLNNFSYQVYLSNSFSLGSEHVLLADQSFPSQFIKPKESVKDFTLNFVSPVDPAAYQYVIIETFSKAGSLPDGHSVFVRGTSAPDLVLIHNGSAVSQGTSVTGDFSIGNNGNSDLDLNKFDYKIFLSNNTTLEQTDNVVKQQACPSVTLERWGGQVNIPFSFLTSVDLSVYKYLIITTKLKVGQSQEEVWYDNQIIVVHVIPVNSASTTAKLLPEAVPVKKQAYSVTQQEDAVQISNTSDQPKNAEYTMYSIDGVVVGKGSFEKDLQFPTDGLKAGMYILHINEGGIVETHKVIVGE